MDLNAIIELNKTAAKTAALVKAGEAINAAGASAVKKALPIYLRGYADEPIGRFLIGNIINLATTQVLKDDPRAKIIGKAALTAGIKTFADKIDVETLIKNVLNKVDPEVIEATIQETETNNS